MAKWTPSAVVTEVRNKIAGVVFTKVRAGSTIRKKVKPVNPRSVSQLGRRSSLTSFARAWGSTLTDVQRAGWNALAATITITDSLGNRSHPSGLQLYERVNGNLATIGVARLDTAPADQNVTALLTMTPTLDSVGPTGSVAYTGTPLPAGHYLVVFASPQLSPGRTSSFPGTAFVFHSAAAAASPANILAAYTAKFGALVAGKKVRLVVSTINSANGAKSIPLSAETIIT